MKPIDLERLLTLLGNEQFDIGEVEQFFRASWSLFQDYKLKKAIAALLGAQGHVTNRFTFNQLTVLWLLGHTSESLTVEEAWQKANDYLKIDF